MPTAPLLPSQLVALPWLTLDQVAVVLQVSGEHVRRSARAGTLPGLQVILGVQRVRTSELLGSNS